MRNKTIFIMLILVTVFALTACTKNNATKNDDAIKFKEEYEALNRKTNSSGRTHRSISIDEDNPFVYITAEELLKKINNEETFYVYFGSKLCPWCRSVIEKAIEVAKAKGITTIYYVDVWDDEGNEILRDKYLLNPDNELEQAIKAEEAYYEILNKFDNVLSNYTLKDANGNQVDVGEKRIYAPNFIYVDKGIAISLVSGISSKQEDSRGDLTDEILEDETNIFNDFFEEDCGC